MKVSLFTALLVLSCPFTAARLHGGISSIADADINGGNARTIHGGVAKDDEKRMILSRAIGKTSPGSLPRALHWSNWQRASVKRSDKVSSSGTKKQKKAKKKKVKKDPLDTQYYNWRAKYIRQVKKWRKKQRKKGEAEEINYYETETGVFRIKLPLLSSKVAYGYTNYRARTINEEMMKRDVEEALRFKVKLLLQRSQFINRQEGDPPPALPALAQPEGGESPDAGEVDDFETNRLEEEVDEGDLLKVSDGKYAFAVFGPNIVVWDTAKGNETVTTVPLPAIDVDYEEPPPPYYPQPRPIPLQVVQEPEVAESNADGGNRNLRRDAKTNFDDATDRGLQEVASLYYCWRPIVPTIHSLMVHQKRLIVVASGYGQEVLQELDYKPAFYDAYSTRIFVYNISDEGKLQLHKQRDIHGRFDSIRAVGNTAHVVTFSSLDTYTHIDEPLSRSQERFRSLDDVEYRKAARRLAKHKLIPDFAERIMKDISTDGELPDIARITMWQQKASEDGKVEESVFGEGIMRYYAQITSFDMLDLTRSVHLPVAQGGAFMPTSYGHTYATEKMLILAGQGWNWEGRVGASRQTTYFLGFALRGDRAVPATVGSIEGHLLNPYAIDIVGDYMRVAVTIRNNMWWFAENANVEVQPTENYVKVLKIPDVDLDDNKDFTPLLEVVGSTESLGLENEVFTGVRFGDNVAYVVTFFQTDPFYVISFEEDETKPQVMGHLNITGFSRYLHFVNEENTLVLGVGQQATKEGRVLGLQVTLYDAKDQMNPKNISQYPFELEEHGLSSSSSAEFDFKAFRFVKLGDETGILIIPFRIDDYGPVILREEEVGNEGDEEKTDRNFNGFALLDVTPSGISLRFTIPHSHPTYYTQGCYQSTQLAERSFVVKGDVTTLKGHSIQTYNLDSKKRLDSIDLDPLTE